jgi:PAS domain S-box-containing protein
MGYGVAVFCTCILAVTSIRSRAAQIRALATTQSTPRSDSDGAAELELNDLRRQQRLVIERAVDVICAIDTNANFVRINRASANAWGYLPEELIGKSLDTVVPDPDAARIKTACLGGKRTLDRVALESQLRKKDGETIHVSWTGFWSATEATLFCIIHDVSEQKRLDALREEFFAMVSHDLKNPLVACIGLLTMLENGTLGELSERGQKIVASTHGAFERMTRLLDDFLQLEKMEAGQFVLQSKKFHLAQAIEEAVASTANQAEEKQIAFVKHVEDVTCIADQERISQVLVNLLSNALKFAPARSTITIAASSRERDVLVSVEDQGRGIPAEKLDRIFNKFEQVDESDNRELDGSGLGLAICKTIVEQHEGQIGVETEVGKGSRFWFTIPKKD